MQKKEILEPDAIFECSDWLLSDSDDGLLIEGYLGKQAELTIPEEIDGRPVSSIRPLAFSPRNPRLNAEQKAFIRDTLALVSIPASVSVKNLAFAGCRNLQLKTPDRWTAEQRLFRAPDCPKVSPASPREGARGIYRTPDTNKILWQEFVVSGDYHTIGAGSLMRRNHRCIYICEGVERIEAGAFANTSTLEEVYLPSTIQYISPTAFEGCDSLPPEMLPDRPEPSAQKRYGATLLVHQEEHEDGASYTMKYDAKIDLKSDELIFARSPLKVRLLQLTEDEATVFLDEVKMPVTVRAGESTHFSTKVSSLGSIIEGARYYDYDRDYDFTLTLENVKEI